MASKKVSSTARSANFSAEEIEMILDYMIDFPELVSGSFSARFPTKEHLSKQWQILASKLTSSNMGIQRTETQVRGKWHDLKYRVKQKHLKHKQFVSLTGGGPGKKTPYTKSDLKIIGLIGLRCVEGISDETCDTTTLTLQNLKKKNMTSDLPTDGNGSENNADNSDYMTLEVEVQSESSSMIEEAVWSVATPVADQENGEIIRNTQQATPSNTQQATPSNTQQATPSNTQQATPSNTQQATPSNTQQATPSNTQQATSSNTQQATPSNTQQATPRTSWPVRKSNNSSTRRGQIHRERKRKRTETELENFEATALEMQKNMCQQVTSLAESVAQVVSTVSSQQEILISINSNIQALLKKTDQTNKLLALVLHADEEFAEQI